MVVRVPVVMRCHRVRISVCSYKIIKRLGTEVELTDLGVFVAKNIELVVRFIQSHEGVVFRARCISHYFTGVIGLFDDSIRFLVLCLKLDLRLEGLVTSDIIPTGRLHTVEGG